MGLSNGPISFIFEEEMKPKPIRAKGEDTPARETSSLGSLRQMEVDQMLGAVRFEDSPIRISSPIVSSSNFCGRALFMEGSVFRGGRGGETFV